MVGGWNDEGWIASANSLDFSIGHSTLKRGKFLLKDNGDGFIATALPLSSFSPGVQNASGRTITASLRVEFRRPWREEQQAALWQGPPGLSRSAVRRAA
jgi:hypothetical protein